MHINRHLHQGFSVVGGLSGFQDRNSVKNKGWIKKAIIYQDWGQNGIFARI